MLYNWKENSSDCHYAILDLFPQAVDAACLIR